MLRVTKSEEADATCFKLEGKLTSCWVDVLEQCWVQAAAEYSGKRMVVDLSAVTYVDGRGTELLGRMYRDGADFQARTCLAKGIVDEIKSAMGGVAKAR
jgi:anti-anti-sigma regulatory factor